MFQQLIQNILLMVVGKTARLIRALRSVMEKG